MNGVWAGCLISIVQMSSPVLCSFPYVYSLALCMSPAAHYAGPCHEFQISGLTAGEAKRSSHSQHPSHILYNIAENARDAESFSFLWFSRFVFNILKKSNWRFPLPHQMLLLQLQSLSVREAASPPVAPGLVSEEHSHHVDTSHFLTRANAGHLTPWGKVKGPPMSIKCSLLSNLSSVLLL